MWLHLFGPSEQLISDGGGEFAGHLQKVRAVRHRPLRHRRRLSLRVERHGQRVQDLLNRAVEEVFVGTEAELEALSWEVVSAKIRYLHRGGYSPMQFIFGMNLRCTTCSRTTRKSR